MTFMSRSIRFSFALAALIAVTITPSRSQVDIRLGGGIGVTIPSSDFGGSPLEYYISYNLMNAFGQAWDDVNPNKDQRLDSYLSLNDNRDPQYTAGDDKHFISRERSIRSIQFTVSILFGL